MQVAFKNPEPAVDQYPAEIQKLMRALWVIQQACETEGVFSMTALIKEQRLQSASATALNECGIVRSEKIHQGPATGTVYRHEWMGLEITPELALKWQQHMRMLRKKYTKTYTEKKNKGKKILKQHQEAVQLRVQREADDLQEQARKADADLPDLIKLQEAQADEVDNRTGQYLRVVYSEIQDGGGLISTGNERIKEADKQGRLSGHTLTILDKLGVITRVQDKAKWYMEWSWPTPPDFQLAQQVLQEVKSYWLEASRRKTDRQKEKQGKTGKTIKPQPKKSVPAPALELDLQPGRPMERRPGQLTHFQPMADSTNITLPHIQEKAGNHSHDPIPGLVHIPQQATQEVIVPLAKLFAQAGEYQYALELMLKLHA